jgi:hypothetical protein
VNRGRESITGNSDLMEFQAQPDDFARRAGISIAICR